MSSSSALHIPSEQSDLTMCQAGKSNIRKKPGTTEISKEKADRLKQEVVELFRINRPEAVNYCTDPESIFYETEDGKASESGKTTPDAANETVNTDGDSNIFSDKPFAAKKEGDNAGMQTDIGYFKNT